MGHQKRTIIVHAYDDDKSNHGVGFSMSGFGVVKDEVRCKKDGTGMGNQDPHKIIFELANRSKVEDLRFPADEDDAMWVAPDDQTCPEEPMHQKHVVRATDVSEDREQLTVKNFNKDQGRYKFALNFLGTDSRGATKTFQFDPVWANQNGGQR